jgi:hypothetical protein
VAIQIEVRASTKEFIRYKDLVDSDWNKTTFHAVLTLLWDVISVSISEHEKKAEWLCFLKDDGEKRLPTVVPEDIADRIRFLSFALREPHIPEMPSDLASGKSKTSAQTRAAIFYLLFQTMVQLKGETGFFQDLQSLLFLNSIHYLLPHLQKNDLKTEFAALANVMHIHAIVVWRDQPSHMFYLLGAIMGQLGHKQARLQFLDRSLSATPIHDHSYLTKANVYWGELLDLGEKDKAMDFLLKLGRNVPESYLDEISDMIKETAEIQEAT